MDAPVAGPVRTGQEHDVTAADAVRELTKAEQAFVSDLVRSSRAQGVALTEHLGYDKHDVAGRNTGNSRNGTRTKRVLTDVRTGPRIATYRVSPSQLEAGCEQHWLVTGETVNAAALVEALPWHD